MILRARVGLVLHAALISSSGPFSHSVNTNRILAQGKTQLLRLSITVSSRRGGASSPRNYLELGVV